MNDLDHARQELWDVVKTLSAAKAQLAATRAAFLETIAGVSEQDGLTYGFKHMVFGMLSVRQWIDLIGLHERRHILQVKEMIGEP